MRDVTIVPYPSDQHAPLKSGAVRIGDGPRGLYLEQRDAVEVARAVDVLCAHFAKKANCDSANLAAAFKLLDELADTVHVHVAD